MVYKQKFPGETPSFFSDPARIDQTVKYIRLQGALHLVWMDDLQPVVWVEKSLARIVVARFATGFRAPFADGR